MYYQKLKDVKSRQERIDSCEVERKMLYEMSKYEKVKVLDENIERLKQEKQKLIKELDGFLTSLSEVEKEVAEKYYFNNEALINIPNNSLKKTIERLAKKYIYTKNKQ